MKTFIYFIAVCFIFLSCKKIVNRNVECRAYSLADENYWFPHVIGDTVRFMNSTGDQTFLVKRDNFISHTTSYTSDTGCGCYDISGQLYTADQDSLWFNSEINYIEDNLPERYESIGFVISGNRSIFSSYSRTELDTISINNTLINDLRIYDLTDVTDSLAVKRIYLARNQGLVRYELLNGDVWLRQNIDLSTQVIRNDFYYTEVICD